MMNDLWLWILFLFLLAAVLANIRLRYRCQHHHNTFWSPASYDAAGNVVSWRRACLDCGKQQIKGFGR